MDEILQIGIQDSLPLKPTLRRDKRPNGKLIYDSIHHLVYLTDAEIRGERKAQFSANAPNQYQRIPQRLHLLAERLGECGESWEQTLLWRAEHEFRRKIVEFRDVCV